MQRGGLAVALSCLWLSFAASPALSQPAMSQGQASTGPYDWRHVVRHFGDVEAALRATPDAAWSIPDPAHQVLQADLRVVCADDSRTFAQKLVLADCVDTADCRERRRILADTARALAEEASSRILVVTDDASVFMPAGLTLMSAVAADRDALRLRAAHDQWFRGWMDPLAEAQAGGRTQGDQSLIMNKVWCAMTRDNAEAAIAYLAVSGFPSDRGGGDAQLAPALINIAIHAAWDPALTAPIRTAGDQAFSEGRLSGYSAAYLVDIDTMAALSRQKIGFLWSCEDGRAYVDPPLIDETESAELREYYGLSTLEAATASRTQRCR